MTRSRVGIRCGGLLFFLAVGGCSTPDPIAPARQCEPIDLVLDDGTCQPPGLPRNMICRPGERELENGGCQPAGLPIDLPCPPGEFLRNDGACQSAGVAPEACAAGFAPDGNGGCIANLPTSSCPAGTMAVPGEMVCRDVSPCGSGPWGSIPIEANTQFVDAAYPNADSDGTVAKPWKTIASGVLAAAPEAIVAIAAGTYSEDVSIEDKPIHLWGRCPSMVKIVGPGGKLGAININSPAASNSEVHDLAVTGKRYGVHVKFASNVNVSRLWVHDVGNAGIVVESGASPANATIHESLVENTVFAGVIAYSSQVTINASTVRGVAIDAQAMGTGIYGARVPSVAQSPNLSIVGSVIEKNSTSGIIVFGSELFVEGSVIRDNLPSQDGNKGDGLVALDDSPSSVRSTVTIKSSVFERNRTAGVTIYGSDLSIESTVLRENDFGGKNTGGFGIAFGPGFKGSPAGVVRTSLVENNARGGIYVDGGDVTIEGTIARAMGSSSPPVTGSLRGTGITYLTTKDDGHSTGVVRSSVLESNAEMGALVQGASDVTFEANVFRDNKPVQDDAKNGAGVRIEQDSKKRIPNVQIHAGLFERNRMANVLVRGGNLLLENSVLRDSLPDASGYFGYGFVCRTPANGGARCTATVRGTLIERSTFAGIWVATSDLILESSVIRSPDSEYGRGIHIDGNPDIGERSTLDMRTSVIEKTHEIALTPFFADVKMYASILSDTLPNGQGKFGDGLFADTSSVVDVRQCEITRNARAGIANFSAVVKVTSSNITCNALDLEGELGIDNLPFSYDGSEGWVCSLRGAASCSELAECNVLSTGIEAPADLPQLD